MYQIIISFLLVFLSELGDKTQLIVLSFSTKLKTITILLGVALGSLFSHGIAIVFGSILGNTGSLLLHQFLEFITYSSFILIGLVSLVPKEEKEKSTKSNIVHKISHSKLNYIFIITYNNFIVFSFIKSYILDKFIRTNNFFKSIIYSIKIYNTIFKINKYISNFCK